MVEKSKMHLSAALKSLEARDYKTAVHYFRLAEQNGSIEAKIELAELYLAGYGVESDGLAAEALLQEVIASNSASTTLISLAMNNLATLYMTGANGIPQDKDRSQAFALKASELGFPI